MCGRFTRMHKRQELVALYRLTLSTPPSNLQPRHNICPTTDFHVIVSDAGKRTFASMRWGLIPRGGRSHSRICQANVSGFIKAAALRMPASG
jgi:putative SOS response-associated peptidase YedK